MIHAGFVKVGKKNNFNGFQINQVQLKIDQFLYIFNLRIMRLNIWENTIVNFSIFINEWYRFNQKAITFLQQIKNNKLPRTNILLKYLL
jgi:hypothetical protein